VLKVSESKLKTNKKTDPNQTCSFLMPITVIRAQKLEGKPNK